MDWKRREIFSRLMVPPDIPIIVRVDGWRFKKVAGDLGLDKPYDIRLIKALIKASRDLMSLNLPIALSFIFSDEISFLISPPLPWNGRVEKISSVVSSFVSASVSLQLGKETSFDGRIVFVRNEGEVLDYLSWRQNEAWRNALNSYALAALLREGLSGEEAARRLHGKGAEFLHELIYKKLGINMAKIPSWQRRGVMVRKSLAMKETKYGPVERRIILVDWELPLFSSPEGREYLKESLEVERVFRE